MAKYSILELPLGFLLLVLTVHWRFDAGSQVRRNTSAARYCWGLAVYAAAAMVPYIVFLHLFYRLGLEGPAPLIALAFTLVGPKLPLFSRVDDWFRNILYRAISMPSEALRLADALFEARIRPSKDVEHEVKSFLALRGFDAEDSWLPAAQPMRELWMASAALFTQVRSWDHYRKYRSFAQLATMEFDVLRQRFDQLSFKVVRVLESIERLGGLCASVECRQADPAPLDAVQLDRRRDPSSDALRWIIRDLLADLREDIAFFHRNLCLYAARSVLATTATARSRRRRLQQLGFYFEPEPPSALTTLGWVFVIYVVVFSLAMMPRVIFDFQGVLHWIKLTTMIATIQVVALAAVIFPKKYFGFANEDLQGRIPWGFVIGASLGAALLGIPIQILFFSISHFRISYPWLLVPLVIAGVAAVLIQDSRWNHIASPQRRRLADSVVMALATLVAVLIASRWRAVISGQELKIMRLLVNIPVALTIGFVAGYVAPSAFRQTLPQSLARPPSTIQQQSVRKRASNTVT